MQSEIRNLYTKVLVTRLDRSEDELAAIAAGHITTNYLMNIRNHELALEFKDFVSSKPTCKWTFFTADNQTREHTIPGELFHSWCQRALEAARRQFGR